LADRGISYYQSVKAAGVKAKNHDEPINFILRLMGVIIF
jgi:hypothetical protein